MEKVTYCRFCNEEHIVSEAKDVKGNAVGLFCNREKALITAFSAIWNGEDVFAEISRVTRQIVDVESLARMTPAKLTSLSRGVAYQFIQTRYARERKLNYYFAQHHILDVIRRMKQRQHYADGGAKR